MLIIYLKAKLAILNLIELLIFRKSNILEPKKILIFRTCLLGDFLFTVPALSKIKENFPDSEIYFLTTYASNQKTVNGSNKYLENNYKTPPWFDLFTPNLIKKVIYIPKINFSGVKIIRKQINELNPDITFIFPHPGESISALLKKMIFLKILGVQKNVFGFRVISDYSYFRKIQFESGRILHKIYGPLIALKESKFFNRIDDKNLKFPINLSQKAIDTGQNLIKDISHKSLIISLAIGSIQPHKKWPLPNFIELGKLILNQYPKSIIVLIGTKNDIVLGETFTKAIGNRVVNLIDKTSISELSYVLQKTHLLIGNDGGAIHLGAANLCKTISIISGIEYPNSVEPWGFQHYAVRKDIECSPCYSMNVCPLKHNNCITQISYLEVFEMVKKAIN